MKITTTPENSSADWKLENYDYFLPPECIAQRPLNPRHSAKLLVYHEESDEIEHSSVLHLANYLPRDSLLVVNQSQVLPCRLLGQKKSGGRGEIFLLEGVGNKSEYSALISTTGKKKVGDSFILRDGLKATIESLSEEGVFTVSFNREIEQVLAQGGSMPIPPYIRNGEGDRRDFDDYQTLFAKVKGSVAAPTAGLHFTPEVLASLGPKGIDRAAITLHVGVGTFAPVRCDHLPHHQMHAEKFSISPKDWQKIERATFKTLVGTTTLRALESFLALPLPREEKFYETRLFLYPGKSIQSCDALLTNFHQPRSTLLMLVSALIGRQKTLNLYREAMERDYRFLSYGDAMLILRRPHQNPI